MISKSLLVGMCVAGSVGVSGCLEREDTDAPDDDAAEEASLALVKLPPPMLCTKDQSHTGHMTRLYWASNNCLLPGTSAGGLQPLVVMLNGNGFGFGDYDYLLQPLVSSGFVAISIHRSALEDGDSVVLAGEVETILESYVLGTSFVANDVDPAAIGLIGHSYGGNAVRHLAQHLIGHPSLGVKAVVTLAQNGADTLFLDGTMAEGYLGIHGTADEQMPPWYTFRHFDKAGGQGSQLDAIDNPSILSRGMKLLAGARHADFADPGGSVTPLGDEVRAATSEYVESFLKLHLQGSSSTYDDLIRGDDLPSGWAGQQAVSQYRHGGYRRTIDNFEDGSLVDNNFLLPTISNATQAQVLTLVPSDTPYPHETGALEVSIGASGQYVSSMLPSGSKRNASLFKSLSLRIAQTSGTPASDVFVRVMNNGAWSLPERLTDHGVIPATTMIPSGGVLVPMHHMGTIRVPLAEFSGGVGNVSKVEISFSGDAVNKTFLLDDLEFSENAFVVP